MRREREKERPYGERESSEENLSVWAGEDSLSLLAIFMCFLHYCQFGMRIRNWESRVRSLSRPMEHQIPFLQPSALRGITFKSDLWGDVEILISSHFHFRSLDATRRDYNRSN